MQEKTGTRSPLPLLIGALIYIVANGIAFPAGPLIEDEVGYLGMAHVVRGGSLDPSTLDQPFPGVRTGPDRWTSKWPIGLPALLAPLTSLGERAPFLLPIAMHLLGAWIFWRLSGGSPWITLLYLFHPTLSLYSRTLMSDLPGAVFILGGLALGGNDQGFRHVAGSVARTGSLVRRTVRPTPKRHREGRHCTRGHLGCEARPGGAGVPLSGPLNRPGGSGDLVSSR